MNNYCQKAIENTLSNKFKTGEKDTGEVVLAQSLVGIGDNKNKLSVIWYKLKEAIATDLYQVASACNSLAEGDWKDIDKNKELFGSLYNLVKNKIQKCSSVKSKVNAWQEIRDSILVHWKKAYEDAPTELIAVIAIDDILFSEEKLSTKSAIEIIKGNQYVWPSEIVDKDKEEILNWYLKKIRQEIRKDITLEIEKINCPVCKKEHDEGSECGYCKEAKESLKGAQNYKDQGDWISARETAQKVLEIWENNEEANNIVKKAQEQLDREIINITNNINQLIKENKFIDAEKKAEENKKLFGGEKYQEISKKIEKAKQDHQDKVKKEKKDKKNEFDKALEKGNWSAAEKLINDLEKFGEKRFDLQNQIDIKRNSVDFDAALKNGKWKEAERSANSLVNLSVGKKEDYEEKIKKAKENFKEYLKKEYVEELQKFNKAISTKKYEDAKNALEQVKQIANTLKNYNEKIHSLEKEEKQFKELQEELIVKALQKVENLNVVVSKEISKITWKKPADYNNGWQIKRKENNAVYKIIKDFTNKNEIEDKNIQQGVEYKYSIIPAYKNGKTNEILLNEENAVESDTVFFVENIKNISGSGEGIDDCASIELNWEMPKISNAVIEITRKPEFSKKIKLDGYNVAYSDTDVKIGKSYIYTLTLQCLNKQIGAFKSDEIKVYQAKPLPAFNEVQKKKTGDGKYSLEWNWLGNESGAIIKKSNQDESIIVHKKRDEKSGSLKFVLQRGEKCDVTLTPFRKIGNNKNLGKETIFTFGEPTKIVCKLISHKKILFKSREPSILEITTDKSLPDLSKIKVCIGPSEPSSIYDGENLGSPKQDINNKGKAILEIPKNCKGYVKIFLDNSISNEWKLEQPEGNYIK